MNTKEVVMLSLSKYSPLRKVFDRLKLTGLYKFRQLLTEVYLSA